MADLLKKLHRNPATGWLARAVGLPHRRQPACAVRHLPSRHAPYRAQWQGIDRCRHAGRSAGCGGGCGGPGPELAACGICVNAVAPGFIETGMVAKMPFLTRELGRRLNALQQGGLPRDVAELITFLCTPGAYGISGNTVRVCGQALVGA